MNKFKKFSKQIRKVNEPRTHKITNSYGAYDYYKYYRKHRPKKPEYILTEKVFYQLLRTINYKLGESLIENSYVKLPERMGKLEIRKRENIPKIDENGKLKYSAPIDWQTTLKLWKEDEQSKNKKQLVYYENRYFFRTYYLKRTANYNNKIFYLFSVNRSLQKRISKAAKDDDIDAFLI